MRRAQCYHADTHGADSPREPKTAAPHPGFPMLAATSYKFRNHTAPNRFAALPMEANDAAPDGSPTALTVSRYAALAAGGWGLIFIEAVAPAPDAKARPQQLMLTAGNAPAFARLVDAIKSAADPAPVVILQINHAGRYAITPFVPTSDPFRMRPGQQDLPLATDSELLAARDSLARLALLAATAGVDGIDVKCCHGYLPMELLAPSNERPGSFGGSFDNRARFVLDLFKTVREALPSHIVGSRVSLYEGYLRGFGVSPCDPDIFDPAEPAALLSRLTSLGADFLCETAGNPYINPEVSRPARKQPLSFTDRHHDLARWAKSQSPSLAVMSAGYTIPGPSFIDRAESALSAGHVDFIGFGRQTFADHELPRKVLSGDISSVRFCAGCATGGCPALLRSGAIVGCTVYKKEYRDILRSLNNSK